MATFLEFAKENSEGWSLVAVKSSIQQVADWFSEQSGVLEYAANQTVQPMFRKNGVGCDSDGNYISCSPSPKEVTGFVVLPPNSEWVIFFRTIYWCDLDDAEWVNNSAGKLSEQLSCAAVASCGGGHGLATQLYQFGTLQKEINGCDLKKVSKKLSSLKIDFPLCFIGGEPLSLFAEEQFRSQIIRADRVRIQRL